jgi:hypothetical protein
MWVSVKQIRFCCCLLPSYGGLGPLVCVLFVQLRSTKFYKFPEQPGVHQLLCIGLLLELPAPGRYCRSAFWINKHLGCWGGSQWSSGCSQKGAQVNRFYSYALRLGQQLGLWCITIFIYNWRVKIHPLCSTLWKWISAATYSVPSASNHGFK